MRSEDIKLQLNYCNFFKVNSKDWDEESLKPFDERKQSKLPRLNKVELTKWIEEQSNKRVLLETQEVDVL